MFPIFQCPICSTMIAHSQDARNRETVRLRPRLCLKHSGASLRCVSSSRRSHVRLHYPRMIRWKTICIIPYIYIYLYIYIYGIIHIYIYTDIYIYMVLYHIYIYTDIYIIVCYLFVHFTLYIYIHIYTYIYIHIYI